MKIAFCAIRKTRMNLSLPRTPQGVYRLSVSTFYFLQGLVFASWACRIPDIKSALGMNDADLGSVLFAVPVGQMSAMPCPATCRTFWQPEDT